MYVDFDTLVGEIITKIEMSDADLLLYTARGDTYWLHHEQDCCESVWIESIDGNIFDLIGKPVVLAEDVHNVSDQPLDSSDESWTWTFYKLGTAFDTVTIRWYGVSNGYYSESVECERFATAGLTL